MIFRSNKFDSEFVFHIIRPVVIPLVLSWVSNINRTGLIRRCRYRDWAKTPLNSLSHRFN